MAGRKGCPGLCPLETAGLWELPDKKVRTGFRVRTSHCWQPLSPRPFHLLLEAKAKGSGGPLRAV